MLRITSWSTGMQRAQACFCPHILFSVQSICLQLQKQASDIVTGTSDIKEKCNYRYSQSFIWMVKYVLLTLMSHYTPVT